MSDVVPAAQANPGDRVNVADEIAELANAAEALARLCREQEFGLATWWFLLGSCMERVARHSGGGLVYTGGKR